MGTYIAKDTKRPGRPRSERLQRLGAPSASLSSFISADAIIGAATSSAFFAGTSAKAAQLAAAHTIWGRPFDGTADVSGVLSQVGGIDFTEKAEGEIGLEIVTIEGQRYLHTSLPFFSDNEISSGGIGGDTPIPVDTTLGGLLNVSSEADDVQTVDKILVRRANASGANSWTLAEFSSISGSVAGVKINGAVLQPGADKIVDLGTVLTSLPSWIGDNKPSYSYNDGYLTGFGALATKSSLDASDIPSLDARKITSGTFADARIASASTWNEKQNAISDLSAIRTGADEGHTAYGYFSDGKLSNSYLENSSITIAGNAVSLGGSISADAIIGAATSAASFAGTSAKAAQLAEAHTIWGQSFDGAADVSGVLSQVGGIDFSGKTTGEIGLEIVTIAGQRYLHTSLPFFSDNEISAGGVDSGDEPSGALYSLTDVFGNLEGGYVKRADGTRAVSGDALTFDGTKWQASPVSATGTATRLDAELVVNDDGELYVSVPADESGEPVTDLQGITVEIARNINTRGGKKVRYGEYSLYSDGGGWRNHRGWQKLGYPYIATVGLNTSAAATTMRGRAIYEVLVSGRKNMKSGTPISFGSLYSLAQTFMDATANKGHIRHGSRRVNRAKWGIRLKKGDEYLTEWLPFHLAYCDMGYVVITK